MKKSHPAATRMRDEGHHKDNSVSVWLLRSRRFWSLITSVLGQHWYVEC